MLTPISRRCTHVPSVDDMRMPSKPQCFTALTSLRSALAFLIAHLPTILPSHSDNHTLKHTLTLHPSGSVTRPIGRMSSGLGRVSLDPSTSMTIGRSAGKPRGDGTFEVKVDESGGSFSKLKPVEEKMSVSTFSLQSFVELSAVGWRKSSALTKLVTLATVGVHGLHWL